MIGLDANNTPHGLEAWAKDATSKAGGQVVDQPRATNVPTDAGARNIDYVIISQSLAKCYDSIYRVEEVHTSPHKVVALRLQQRKTRIF